MFFISKFIFVAPSLLFKELMGFCGGMDARNGQVTSGERLLERGRQACSRRLGERGQTLVEYALILGLVSIVVIVLLVNMGDSIMNIFNTIINTFENAFN